MAAYWQRTWELVSVVASARRSSVLARGPSARPPDMNAGRVYTHTVRRGEADTPLLTLLTTKYLHSSALEWVEHISNNRVLVDGLPGTSEQRPHEGATIHYHRPPWIEPPAPIAELKVLHDDGALVVLHKPSGLPVLPSELYYEHSVLRRLHHSRPSDAVAPHPAHRLGVGTSGLLLCAVGGPARQAARGDRPRADARRERVRSARDEGVM